jgi:hypothetical protein
MQTSLLHYSCIGESDLDRVLLGRSSRQETTKSTHLEIEMDELRGE